MEETTECRSEPGVGAGEEPEVASLLFEAIREGDRYAFETRVSAAHLDTFAALTGDVSPLHMDGAFARSRGFAGRVAHGVLTIGFFSRIVGVFLPGRHALLQSVQIRFAAPVCCGDCIVCEGVVEQKSEENRVIVLKVTARRCDSRQITAQGKMQVGFTRAVGEGA